MNDRYGWDDRNDSERWRRHSGEGSYRSHQQDHNRGRSEDDDWRSRSGQSRDPNRYQGRSDFDREQRFGGSGTLGYGEGRQSSYGAYGYVDQGRGYGAQQSYASESDRGQRRYTSSDYGYGASSYGNQQGDTTPPQPYYTGQQQGFEVPSSYGAPGTFGSSYGGGTGTYGGGAGGFAGYGEDYREHAYGGRQHERGFLQRAGDEVASWFGDEDAARRREQDHRGRGPADYTRSDERIREDANDRLTEDWRVDASRVSVAVKDGEVTLSGTVNRREDKRRAEDIVEDISGVKHVQNNLRVQDASANWSGGSTTATAGASPATSDTAKAKTNTSPT